MEQPSGFFCYLRLTNVTMKTFTQETTSSKVALQPSNSPLHIPYFIPILRLKMDILAHCYTAYRILIVTITL